LDRDTSLSNEKPVGFVFGASDLAGSAGAYQSFDVYGGIGLARATSDGLRFVHAGLGLEFHVDVLVGRRACT
jgi:hypothetical protein